jgi:hypothetical protein
MGVDMSGRPGGFEDLYAESDQLRIDFLRTDLAMCLTLTELAATRLQIGHEEAAKQTIAEAEKGYKTILGFLSDPKHSPHVTDEDRRELTTDLEKLRQSLAERRQRLAD